MRRSTYTILCLTLCFIIIASACTSSTSSMTHDQNLSGPEMPEQSISDEMSYDRVVRLFDYDNQLPFNSEERSFTQYEGYSLREIVYTTHKPGYGITKGLNLVYLLRPDGPGPYPGILFMHWLGTFNGNREEFLGEAKILAQAGIVSLLINGNFPYAIGPRGGPEDRREVIAQVRELRRALDFLISLENVDPGRIAFVGHDYGALYGGILSGVETRLMAIVLMNGMGTFSDWSFTFYSRFIKNSTEEEYREAMALVDPIVFLPHTRGIPLFFQCSLNDPFISKEKAEGFFLAAGEPKTITWYKAPHYLDEAARADRIEWLKIQFQMQ